MLISVVERKVHVMADEQEWFVSYDSEQLAGKSQQGSFIWLDTDELKASALYDILIKYIMDTKKNGLNVILTSLNKV